MRGENVAAGRVVSRAVFRLARPDRSAVRTRFAATGSNGGANAARLGEADAASAFGSVGWRCRLGFSYASKGGRSS
jgi:hypothetical protein